MNTTQTEKCLDCHKISTKPYLTSYFLCELWYTVNNCEKATHLTPRHEGVDLMN